jgi:hypothetical protein
MPQSHLNQHRRVPGACQGKLSKGLLVKSLLSLASIFVAGVIFYACGNEVNQNESDLSSSSANIPSVDEGSQVACLLANGSCTFLKENQCAESKGQVLGNSCPGSANPADSASGGSSEDGSGNGNGSETDQAVFCKIGTTCESAYASSCMAANGTIVASCTPPAPSSSSPSTPASSASVPGGVSSPSGVSSNSGSGTPTSCITRDGTAPSDPRNTCFVYNGKCYKCHETSGADCSPDWFWKADFEINLDYWQTEVDCGGSIPTKSSASAQPNPPSSTSSTQSSASTGGDNTTYPTLTTANAKPGWTSRYWDGCRPHCAQTQQQQPGLTYPAKTCAKDGTTKLATGTANICKEGGPAYACFDQTPHVVNDQLAYAFAAVPGSNQSAYCGKCFQIQFDGGSKYDANANHAKIKGKTLIVMATNIGHDVGGGQFDVQIPGGGLGEFDGFSGQIGVSPSQLGVQFGGLLSACENEKGYSPEGIAQYASCVETKCNSLFASNETLKKGCSFIADWYEAASNPTMLYKEVECPQYLKDRY